MVTYLETHALNEEGILRIPGSSAQISTQQQKMEASFIQGTFSFEEAGPIVVSSLLKTFIR